jgi:hypothetical protein
MTLHVELHAVASAAEYLHAGVRDLHIGLRRKQLGHRDHPKGIGRVVADHPCGAPDQGPGGLKLGLQVRQHVGDCLERADRTAELLPVFGIAKRQLKRRLRPAAIAGGGRDPFDLQAGQHARPAVVLAADQVTRGYADMVER